MRPREVILIAVALVFVIANWVPFGHEALYPLTLFTTWVHEMGHGLTALALGGRFDSLEIFSHAGGLAHCEAGWGWHMAVVALGGLLAPPIVGSLLIAFVHGPRRARIALTILSAGLVVSLVIYVRSVAGIVAMPIVAAGLGWAAWLGFRDAPQRRVLVIQILGRPFGIRHRLLQAMHHAREALGKLNDRRFRLFANQVEIADPGRRDLRSDRFESGRVGDQLRVA